jgi:hypothetical protein
MQRQFINDELGRICTEAVAAESREIPDVCLEGLTTVIILKIYIWFVIAGVLAEIKTKDLWFTSMYGFRYINHLGGHSSLSVLSIFSHLIS